MDKERESLASARVGTKKSKRECGYVGPMERAVFVSHSGSEDENIPAFLKKIGEKPGQ
jgi:hypothetical protein